MTSRLRCLEGGPSLSLPAGGWVRANRTSSGMKSLWEIQDIIDEITKSIVGEREMREE